MTGHACHRHPTQLSDDTCGSCGRSYCEPCLHYLDGDHALPRCNHCALVAAGIRPPSSVRPALSRRQLRQLRRQRRRHGKPPTRVEIPPEVALRPVPDRSTEGPERDPFAWADDLDGGWSVVFDRS